MKASTSFGARRRVAGRTGRALLSVGVSALAMGVAAPALAQDAGEDSDLIVVTGVRASRESPMNIKRD